MDLKLEGNRTYPIENKIRTLCSIPNYLVWCLFDCNRKERRDAIYARIGAEEWEEDKDSRVDEIGVDQIAGGRTILTYAARIGEEKPDLGSSFSFRIG